MTWFSVRCVYRLLPPIDRYVERITVWRATSFPEVLALAEHDAQDCAAREGLEYLGFADAFQMPQAPEDGIELFSLMRDSDLDAVDYVVRVFATGGETALS